MTPQMQIIMITAMLGITAGISIADMVDWLIARKKRKKIKK